MRHLITFIMRLWVDVQVEPPAWEGQVECVTDSEHEHVRTPEELMRFIHTHTTAGTLTTEDQLLVTAQQPANDSQ